MFALPLDDPLWHKLDDAHRNRDMADALRKLGASWDAEGAASVFWDHLCHQDTCYGATYAAIPHMLGVAVRSAEAREDIAGFLGHVARVAFTAGGCRGEDSSIPQGLPLDLRAWDRKLDTYRSLAEHARRDLADPPNLTLDFDKDMESELSDVLASVSVRLEEMGIEKPSPEQFQQPDPQADLDRYEEILARPPVDADDLIILAQIRDTFYAALPKIADLCADVYLAIDTDERFSMLAGVAAGMQDRGLAELLDHGTDAGHLNCTQCGWGYVSIRFSDCLGLYADPVPPGEFWSREGDAADLKDCYDGVPNRADVIIRAASSLRSSPSIDRLKALTAQANDTQNKKLLDLYLSHFECAKCGARVPVCKEHAG